MVFKKKKKSEAGPRSKGDEDIVELTNQLDKLVEELKDRTNKLKSAVSEGKIK